MNIKTLFNATIDLLFPSECPACGEQKAPYPSPVCEICEDILLSEDRLPVISTYHVKKVISCRPYREELKECIKHFKYFGAHSMRYIFATMIRQTLNDPGVWPAGIDLIVPVPMSRSKRRKRGFNQSRIIAHILSKYLSAPISYNNLIKKKNTLSQMGLSRAQRIRNLKGSFAIVYPSAFKNMSVLLVDDVMTTGVTLDTCALELKKAGAGEISAFTLARTL